MSVAAAPTFAGLLRAVWPDHTAKRAAGVTRGSVRTVQDWLQQRCCPSADTLLRMARENEQLRAELVRALEGQDDRSLAAMAPADAGTTQDQAGAGQDPGQAAADLAGARGRF